MAKNALSAKYALQLEKAQTWSAFSRSHTNEVASTAAVDRGQNSSLIRFTGWGPVLSSQHQQVGNATTSCIERKWDICLTSHITKTIISQEYLHHFIHSFMKGNYFSLSFLQALKLLKASLRQVRCASLTTVIYLIIFTKLFSCLFSKFSLLGVIMHLYLSKTASYCNIHTEKIYSESHSVHA